MMAKMRLPYLAVLPLWLLATPAVAEPKAEAVCLPFGNIDVSTSDGGLVLCDPDGTTCSRFSDLKSPPTQIKRPAAVPASSPVRTDHGKLSACVADKCVALGAKVAQAYGELKDRYNDDAAGLARDIQVSPALDVIWVGGFWSIPKDAQITIKTPPKVPDMLQDGDVVGKWLIPMWSEGADLCTGPRCKFSGVFDATGKQVGKLFPGGAVVRVDDHQVAIAATEAQKLTVIDLDTGAQRGQIALDSPGLGLPHQWGVARLDDTTLALAWLANGTSTWRLSWIKFDPKKGPKALGTRKVASCGP